ncbi:MAG: hypothetical protein R3A78_14415 [Polyangiales bacterium]
MEIAEELKRLGPEAERMATPTTVRDLRVALGDSAMLEASDGVWRLLDKGKIDPDTARTWLRYEAGPYDIKSFANPAPPPDALRVVSLPEQGTKLERKLRDKVRAVIKGAKPDKDHRWLRYDEGALTPTVRTRIDAFKAGIGRESELVDPLRSAEYEVIFADLSDVAGVKRRAAVLLDDGVIVLNTNPKLDLSASAFWRALEDADAEDTLSIARTFHKSATGESPKRLRSLDGLRDALASKLPAEMSPGSEVRNWDRVRVDGEFTGEFTLRPTPETFDEWPLEERLGHKGLAAFLREGNFDEEARLVEAGHVKLQVDTLDLPGLTLGDADSVMTRMYLPDFVVMDWERGRLYLDAEESIHSRPVIARIVRRLAGD